MKNLEAHSESTHSKTHDVKEDPRTRNSGTKKVPVEDPNTRNPGPANNPPATSLLSNKHITSFSNKPNEHPPKPNDDPVDHENHDLGAPKTRDLGTAETHNPPPPSKNE